MVPFTSVRMAGDISQGKCKDNMTPVRNLNIGELLRQYGAHDCLSCHDTCDTAMSGRDDLQPVFFGRGPSMHGSPDRTYSSSA